MQVVGGSNPLAPTTQIKKNRYGAGTFLSPGWQGDLRTRFRLGKPDPGQAVATSATSRNTPRGGIIVQNDPRYSEILCGISDSAGFPPGGRPNAPKQLIQVLKLK